MRGKLFLPVLLVWALFLSTSTRGQAPATTQPQQSAPINAPNPSNPQSGTVNARSGQTARSPNEIIEGVFKREKEQDEIIASYAPIVETYIQTEKSDPLMGTLPKHDFYFLGQADFRGKTMKVQPMTKRTHTGSIMWSLTLPDFYKWLSWISANSTKTTTRLPIGAASFWARCDAMCLMLSARQRRKVRDFGGES